MSKEILVEVKNLKQYFDGGKGSVVKAVDGISFEIFKGETFGLVGESGSGKSTTGRSIIKLYNITGGEVFFKGNRTSVGIPQLKKELKDLKVSYNNKISEYKDQIKARKEVIFADEIERMKLDGSFDFQASGDDNAGKISLSAADKKRVIAEDKMISEIENNIIETKAEKVSEVLKMKEIIAKAIEDSKVTGDFRRTMQMIFQDPMACLNPRMPVKSIIAEGLDIHKLCETPEERDQKVYEILNIVGLDKEHADRYPHEFSGGQRQRIGIARALITRPEFVIADEPISALDVSIQAQVVNLLDKLKEDFGLTYLFIAHDLSMVKYISDRIAVMHLGKIVEIGTSDEIYDNAIHPYTKSLLSSIPLPDPNYERTRKRIIYNKSEVDYDAGVIHKISDTHYVLGTDEDLKKWK